MLEKVQHDSHAFTHISCDEAGCRFLWLTISPSPESIVNASASREGLAAAYLAQLGSITDQLQQLLESRDLTENMVILNVFLADIGMKQLIRNELRRFFGQEGDPDQTPVTTYIPQRPADGALLVISGVAIGGESVEIGLAHREESVTCETNGIKWCYIGGVVPDDAALGPHDRSLWTLRRLEQVLLSRSMNVDDLLRTWIYQGNLTFEEDGVQRYKELNRARTTFFQGHSFFHATLPLEFEGVAYPASTGIGADDGDVTVAAVAIKTDRPDVFTIPLENPNQTAAFDYAARYSPQSPKFSRAVALCSNEYCLLTISGTASITDSETRFPNAPESQTIQTLDNIERLIAESNLNAHGIEGFAATLHDMVAYRVYVKRPADYEKIAAICRQRIPNTPFVATIADVCRPDLLVEIEGVAVVRKK